MYNLKRLVFLLFILLSSHCFADVFVVTSMGDSGPGSLREALTQAAANGSAVKDYINFNLAGSSITERTITIITELPDLSSNLVIDGSTQPGAPFDVSTAKVRVYFNPPVETNFIGFNITDKSDIEIYGIYLKLQYKGQESDFSPTIGIAMSRCNNIHIGDAQKGNVISGFFLELSENYFNHSDVSMNLILKNNFIGLLPDGVSTFNSETETYIGGVYGTIIIGGNPDEGNVFAEELEGSFALRGKQVTMLVKNNKIGVNYNATGAFATVSTAPYGLKIDNIGNSALSLNVEDNIVCNEGSVNLYLNSSGATVLRNYLGVDKNLTKLGGSQFGIYASKSIQVGNSNAADANYIGYCQPITAANVSGVAVHKNSFFCTTLNAIYSVSDGPHPQCKILNISANSVSGTATPNSAIELFHNDICGTCAPQYYFGSTTADANGNWVYNGAAGGDVIASATYNNSTSEFTKTGIFIDMTKFNVNPACGATGSITGLVPYGAASVDWVDKSGNIVSHDNDLVNVPAGTYQMIIKNGGCTASSNEFIVRNVFNLATDTVKITYPVCGNSAGSITGLEIQNANNYPLTFSWTDANGKEWSTDPTLRNVPPGTYTLVASSSQCTQSYGPVALDSHDQTIPPPLVNDITLCSGGDAILRVKDPSAGHTYRLYDSQTSINPLDEQATGAFKITVNTERSFYVSQLQDKCESDRVQVHVGVGISAATMANAITPNGDGINDYWVIPGIENYANAQVQIFARGGQKVYEAKGYTIPFNGTYNGKQLPAGVYYYIINLNTKCNLLTGNLTIIR